MPQGKGEVCKLANLKKAELNAKRRESYHRKKAERAVAIISIGSQVYWSFNTLAHMSDYEAAYLNVFYHSCGILVEPNRYTQCRFGK
jgi:hypothetical protein